ncbi:MAG: Iron transport system permease [Bacteroidetes bacterium]|nr:Iron transport system permease [Bacteroidota bacterium]
MTKQRFIATTIYLMLLIVALITCDLCFGSVNLFSLDRSDPLFQTILYDIRLPKTLTAVVAGSGLALCGLLMQSLFRNPLAGPYVLGVSSGASLFVAVATMLISSVNISGFYFMGKSIVTLFSIGGAFFVTLIILMVSRKNKNNVTLLLVGLMVGQVLGALQGLIEFMSSADNLKTFILWGMGSVGSTTLTDVWFMVPVFFAAVIAGFFLIRSLNAILLNEQYAQNLGVNVNRLRVTIIIITAMLVGVITAFCGPIAFVGISVPIASRLFFKTSHHLHQMVFCLLLGACVVLAADVICQLVSNQLMLPINTVTTIIGSPVVIYLLFKSKLSVG